MARAMLRETIDRLGWYSALHRKERRELIERDVKRHWHLMRDDARRGLEQRRESS